MSFFAVELLPGKEQTTTPEFDLILCQAVLPESAKDKSRTVVSVKVGDIETPFAIASLTLGSHENQNLDILLDAGAEVTFYNSGKNPVHLVGRFHEDEDMEGMMDEYGSEEEGDFSGSEEEDNEDIDEATLSAEIEAASKKRHAAAVAANGGNKGGQQQQQPAAKKQKGSDGSAVPAPSAAKPAAKQEPKQQQAKPAAQQQQQKSPQAAKVVKLQGGMTYEILKNGSGSTATRGKQVAVKYVGKLPNGKVFDSSTKKPFKFKLGAGEVIRGWDLGVEGMTAGEKRKLIIPPELAYGKRGAPPEIPPNSTLHFDVEFLG